MASQRIHIVHMNDLHSNFSNIKKISSYIQTLKNEFAINGESLIVVDLGDNMDRYQMETEGTNGKINVEILNKLGVDYITIGNNEGLTFSKEALNQAYENANFKIILANLKDKTTQLPPNWVSEYIIEKINGLTIGFIGATAPYTTFYEMQGWTVEEPIERVKKITTEIKPKVDLIILLSHLGLHLDGKVANEIAEIDLILGAHTHHFFENGTKKENQPLICQMGIFGDYIGHVTIEHIGDKVQSINEKAIEIKNFADDYQISELIAEHGRIAKENLSVIVTNLKHSLPISINEESPLGNLLAEGVRQWVNAEIGFINNGQFTDGLEKGIVTKGRIHEICPSPINACKVILTGEQIRITLEQSLMDEFIYLPLKGYGFRGKFLGTLSLAGIEVEYKIANNPYERISKITVNDKPLREEEMYTVGTLDMFTFGGGYSVIKSGTNIEYFLPEFIRDILAIQLSDIKSIEQSFIRRWIETK